MVGAEGMDPARGPFVVCISPKDASSTNPVVVSNTHSSATVLVGDAQDVVQAMVMVPTTSLLSLRPFSPRGGTSVVRVHGYVTSLANHQMESPVLFLTDLEIMRHGGQLLLRGNEGGGDLATTHQPPLFQLNTPGVRIEGGTLVSFLQTLAPRL